MSINELDIEKVFVSELNVRRAAGDITELTKSIEKYGILEPIVVRPVGNRYEVIVGRRRYEAAKAAGLKTITARIRKMNDEEAIISSLIENIQRRDIEPEEEYDGYVALKRTRPKEYDSYESIAKVVDKEMSHVRDVFLGVEAIRAIRKANRTKMEVKLAPPKEDRERGEAIPLRHATIIHSVKDAETVRELPKKVQEEKLGELAEAIAPLPHESAQKVADYFKMYPEKTIEKVKEEALAAETGVRLEIYLRPKVARELERAARDRGISMGELVSVAVEEWLKQVGYPGAG